VSKRIAGSQQGLVVFPDDVNVSVRSTDQISLPLLAVEPNYLPVAVLRQQHSNVDISEFAVKKDIFKNSLDDNI
jgi:hypothetical protein